ncbi:MAG: TraR/DksA C4-type zinc finger protein [Nitrospira sp.]|nr:TraR/DksA C4-type zinc finger protein [Nitrospira sp.]
MPVMTLSRPSRRPLRSRTASPPPMTSVNGKRLLLLKLKLTKQRAVLLANAPLSLLAEREAEAQPDPLDQATEGLEQELAIQARIRTLDQLHRIERALYLIQTEGYGRCRRCQEAIPYKRLAVKPETLYCVPCLTLIEKG